MYEQVKALKEGIAVEKPIYNHVSGLLDPPELIKPPKILVIEGLHPMYDSRVRDVLDLSIYLDISNEVKFAWKIQRDMAERGHSLESIEARKPDFDAYIVIEVLATQLIEDDEGKVLRLESEVDHERRGSPSEQHIHQVLRRSDAADADFPGSSNCSRPSWG